MSSSGLQRLKGRRVIITGASSGIGRETANLFIAEGAVPILLDMHGDGAAKALGDVPGASYEVDITDEQAVAAAIANGADKLGGIDGVVNAAGTCSSDPPMSSLLKTGKAPSL